MFLNLIIFLVVFSVIVISHEFGHFITAKLSGMKVEEFGIGFPPKVFGIKKGETEYTINAIPLGGFVKILGENGEEDEKNIKEEDLGRTFSAQPIWKRSIVLSAGVFMNFLLGFLFLIPVFMIGAPNKIIVTDVVKDSPAQVAGIKIGDSILEFNNIDDFVKYAKENSGKKIGVRIERRGEEKVISIIPRKNPPKDQGALGIALIEGGFSGMSFFEAVWLSIKRSIEMFFLIFIMLFKLVASIFNGSGLWKQVAGPVGIYKATTQAAGLGWIYLLNFVALISLNLAALNIFPFPALDGGRLIFLLVERLKGSPVSKKIQGWTNSIGFALLILLLILVTIKDIYR